MDKPLHVQVAEALGCQPKVWAGMGELEPQWHCHCEQDKDGQRAHLKSWDREGISRYDTDWSTTGPLLEKHQISIQNCGRYDDWVADQVGCGDVGEGSTPLIAVCNLILKLKEAGGL
jgi:hypothetical protein